MKSESHATEALDNRHSPPHHKRSVFFSRARPFWLAAALVGCLATDTVSGQAPSFLTNGLVAWWPGDDTTDIVGARNGSLMGSAAFAPGKVGGAFSFDGSGWIDIPDEPVWTLG